MSSDKRDERRRQIEAAAFALLAEKGYRSTSMLQIAKRASASNQTLYAWYGSKQALFQSLIEENARAIKELILNMPDRHSGPLGTLRDLGPLLLEFTTSEKAIIMNRAAIADAGEAGILGEAIDKAARQELVTMITSVMQQLITTGRFRRGADPSDAAESYISLLLGEVPMQQALGRMAPLDSSAIASRAARAFDLTVRLYGNTD